MSVGEHEVPGCLVLLEEEQGERMIPIWIHIGEGQELVRALKSIQLRRPLTSDLTATLLSKLGATIREARISDLQDETFLAVLEVQSNGTVHELDCRPSDAMTQAVRAGARIVVSEEFLTRVGQKKKESLTGSGIESIAAKIEESLG